jgi:hypothetical protein
MYENYKLSILCLFSLLFSGHRLGGKKQRQATDAAIIINRQVGSDDFAAAKWPVTAPCKAPIQDCDCLTVLRT